MAWLERRHSLLKAGPHGTNPHAPRRNSPYSQQQSQNTYSRSSLRRSRASRCSPRPQPSLALSPYARPEVSRLLGQAGHGAGCGSEGLETTESRVQVGRRGRSGGRVSRRGGGHGSCAAATAAATERAPGFE